ncbi:MAG: GEVED domain-containing protein [Bacteroidia bacterium]|nr:GEVED domain-containing protein [Bacteroidia bacterium]
MTAVITGAPACDVGILGITSPVTAIQLNNAEPVTVQLINYGTAPVSNFTVTYTIQETGVQVSETLQDTLYFGNTLTHTFTTLADLTLPDTFHICAYTSYYCDTYTSNDTACVSVINLPLVYCIPTFPSYGCSGPYGYISNVTTSGGIQNIVHNPSLCDGNAMGYGYFPSSTYPNYHLVVQPGQTITLTLQGYETGFGVWADWNHDGIFKSSEFMFGTSYYTSSTSQVVTGTFQVPGNAVAGTHRFRVIGWEWNGYTSNGPTDPCGTYSEWGETEDYDVTVLPLVPYDADITSIISPTGAAPQNSTTNVVVGLMNTGTQPLTAVSVYYTLNGVIQDTVAWTGNLAFLGTSTVTFTGMVVPAGAYTICAYLIYPPDMYAGNNFACGTGFGVASFNLPWYDNFDGTSYWQAGPASNGSQWQLGMPAFGSTTGTFSGDNAWDINLTTAYTNSANCTLTSPFFNFSGIYNASIEFELKFNTELNYDGTRLDYSTNGVNWYTLGAVGSPNSTNWYNIASIYSTYLPAWAGTPGTSGNWIKPTFLLDQFNNYSSLVQFRFSFNSDGSVTYDGVSLDNFAITVPLPWNAGVTAVTAPLTNNIIQNMTTPPVQCTIKNFGLDTITGLQVAYKLNGGTPVIQSWTGSLAYGATDNVSLPGFIPIYGNNTLCCYTILAGDTVDNMNDTTCVTLFALPQYDLAITGITAPTAGCDMTLENVTITIHNNGDTIFGNIPVSYHFGFISPVTETISATILPGANYTYTFTTPADLTSAVQTSFTIYASVNYPADPAIANNTTSTTIINGVTPPLPSANNVTIWSGSTATLNVNSPTPGQTYSWWNSPTGTSLGYGTSYTTPPLFDTTVYYLQAGSNGTSGALTTNYTGGWYADGVMFDITTTQAIHVDSFRTWVYQAGTIWIYYKPGTYVGSTANSSAWTLLGSQTVTTTGQIILSTIGGFPAAPGTYGIYITDNGTSSVEFSSGSNTYTDGTLTFTGGIAIYYPFGAVYQPYTYNGTIYYSSTGCPTSYVPVTVTTQYPPYDAYMWAITAPVSGTNLTASQVVTANVYNNGLNPLNNIPIHYTINGGTPVNEVINLGTTPLAPGAHYIYNFTATADLSAYATYHICVYTTYPGDGIPANDNLCADITNSPPNTCTPSYTYNCSDGDQLVAFHLADNNQSSIPCSGGYIDYTSISIHVQQDSTYLMSGTCSYYGYEYVTIWVDYNNDGTFSSDEEVVTNWYFASAGSTVTHDFMVPEFDATTLANTGGTHHMRLTLVCYQNPTDPCGSYSYGQTMDYTIVVQSSVAFTLTSAVTNLTCAGAGNGAIDLSIVNTSGVTPFTYNWSNSQTTQDLTGLAAGTYTVTVTDAAAHTNTATATVTEPYALTTLLSPTDVTTLGGNTGAITQTTSGGVTPYTYLWAPGGQTTVNLSNLYGGNYQVTVTDAHGCTVTAFSTILTPNPWSPAPTITTVTHNIHIPASALITLDASTAPPGSWLGVFFHQGNTLVCGGAQVWNNMATDLIAYGNTASGGQVNGFAAGEVFTWKLWTPTPLGAHPGTATYIQPPTYPQTNTFLSGGSSGISALAAITVQYQTINLPSGWGIWSTYIIPTDPNLKNVLSAIQPVPYDNVNLTNNKVVIVKDQVGHVYWPQFGLCTIGEYTGSTQNNFNIILGQGYQIKTTQASSFTVAGLACVPEISPITLNTGWYIIGYLRMTPGPIVGANGIAMLSTLGAYTGSATNCITIMKDQVGHVYWPQFSLCTIGEYTGSTQNNTNMVPGQGYQIKMACAGTLYYPPNSSSSYAKADVISIPAPFYYGDVENTGNNMTLGIPAESWTTKPVIGDEIGVFNPSGELSGSSVYFGGNTEITIWGDDMTTPFAEGVGEGQPFTIKIWHQETNTVDVIVVNSWVEGSGSFTSNGISIAGKSMVASNAYALLQNNPNPFRETTTITFRVPEDTQVSISLYNVLGDKISDIVTGYYKAGEYKVPFNATGLAAGSYFYQIITSGFVATRQMSISK